MFFKKRGKCLFKKILTNKRNYIMYIILIRGNYGYIHCKNGRRGEILVYR